MSTNPALTPSDTSAHSADVVNLYPEEGKKRGRPRQDPRQWSSSTMAAFMAQQPHVAQGGTADLAARALSFDVASYYNPEKGYAYPTMERLATLTGVSASSIRRHSTALASCWHITSGGVGSASRFTPHPSLMSAARAKGAGKTAVRPPSALFYEDGYPHTPSTPKTPVAPVHGFPAPVLVPGAHGYWKAFAASSLTPAEKLAVLGITHSDRIVQVMGALAYPDLATRGFSIILASHIVPQYGWFSTPGAWLQDTYGLTARQVMTLGQKLVDSGLWVRTRDASTHQNIWTLSDLALGQIAAHAAAGRPRITIQRCVRDIAGIIAAEWESIAQDPVPPYTASDRIVEGSAPATSANVDDEYTEFI